MGKKVILQNRWNYARKRNTISGQNRYWQKFTVLDLGCGDGTTAIPIAKTGAQVLGVDIASNLVAAGNARVRKRIPF